MSSPYATPGKSSGGGSAYTQSGSSSKSSKSAPKKHGGGGFFHTLARDTGAEFVGNLAKDVGQTAVGVGPGIYRTGRALGTDLYSEVRHPSTASQHSPFGGKKSAFTKDVVKPTIANYKHTYGPLAHGDFDKFGKQFYQHPLGPILDIATVLSGGAGAAAKLGKVASEAGVVSDTSRVAKLGERSTVTTRSPRAIATGKGPVHRDITSTKPLVKGRQIAVAKARSSRSLIEKKGGEIVQYGKQIQAEANQHALGHLTQYQPYLKATRRLSQREWVALHIRAMDIHPNELKALWKGTPAEKWANDPKVVELALKPTKRIAAAEAAARDLSARGAKLLTDRKLLKEETAAARPDLTKRQASEVLGRKVEEIHGKPYYLPHVLEDAKGPGSPLTPRGGGKGIPRKPGATHENLGILALRGKLHLRGDVLGPEFLRRVKYVKYDEIHNALTRGAIRVTKQELEQHYGGKLPQGYEYIRTKPGGRTSATMRGESDVHNPINKLIPNPDDLHDSTLAKEGFSTTDPAVAHQSGGHYYIVPKGMVKAATGEFTRSSTFVHHFVAQPLRVWRSAVLGLRVGFFTNNFVGNSIMYAAKTGGQGALRDLFMAIKESRGDAVAKKVLDSAATPPELRQSLYKEFFPEQVHGTFGMTQSPSVSALGAATSKTAGAYRAATGAIPKVTSAVAETAPRMALIRHFIRHSPEFKNVYKSLPRQTRDFETAARQILEGKGGKQYQRFISKQVNQALGDYLNLSPFERNVMRNAIPFYSWYRAITTTTYHLAADTPLRANILGQIGQIGKQWSDQQLGKVPTFLEGAIPLGKTSTGLQRALGTQSLNPYATLEQVRRGAGGDVSGLGINPFAQGALDAYAKGTAHGGKIGAGQIAADTLQQMLLGLPPARVAKPAKPSKLYPKRNRRSEAESFMGIPIKTYDPRVAAQQAKKGR